ncbi:pantetheine-phosphate adenylyltransferase [Fusibacter sp. JL216-2]|uniref:pantetheine-phosphate adenylyltransferase n=1 Tax=Fusibacter sp. JL216-2 TaxID=3071453 RepID=UPI003D324870
MKTAVYPGSFDPVTKGHLDIIERSSKLFDKVIVVASNNTSKTPMFTVSEKVDLLTQVVSHLDNVVVDSFHGLLVDYVDKNNVDVIVKGLRAISDFEMEFQMAGMNRKLNPKAETVFLMTSTDYSYLSSSIVKEIFKLGGPIHELVPQVVEDAMKKKKSGGGIE